MTIGGAVTALAGMWALAIENTPGLQAVVPHARLRARVDREPRGRRRPNALPRDSTPDDERPHYTAIDATLSGALGILVALVFGTIARIQGSAWPVLLVVAMNILATWFCFRLPEQEPEDVEAQGQAGGA